MLGHHDRFSDLLKSLRSSITDGAPLINQLDFRIVELKGNYIHRDAARVTPQLVRDFVTIAESGLDVSLRIELLQTVFRVHARKGRIDDARKAFELYRELMTEIVANVDPEDAKSVAETYALGELIREYRILTERGERREGDPMGSPPRGSSH
jgi:hypothetical protein